MIAMIICAKRAPHLTFEEFSKYWVETHAPLVMSVPEFMRHVKKYIHYYISPSAENSAFTSVGQGYDGVGELWFDDVESMEKAYKEPMYFEKIFPDEEKFLDRGGCLTFITSRRVMHSSVE
jgi:uncharacterized protein (TIGR02118 family)